VATRHQNPEKLPGAAAPESAVEEVAGEVVEAFEEAGELSVRVARGVVIGTLSYLGEVGALLGQAVRALRRGVHLGDLVRQMAVIGVDSIPIALLTVGFSGAVLALYSVGTLQAYGASNLVGGIVAVSIVKETGPILTGVALASRAGSAMTAEIASMKVSEQIDALRSMAISPIEYLVAPRLLACLIMLPVVCLCADAAGVAGGGVVASSLGVSSGEYAASIRQILRPDGSDVYKGLIKTVVFGAIIAVVACREGLGTEGGATGVGQSTTRSVVLSIVLVFIANFLLSFLMFGGGLL
jgi:phospholipid/cholesterol/gamma-HCH transport system permease protein